MATETEPVLTSGAQREIEINKIFRQLIKLGPSRAQRPASPQH